MIERILESLGYVSIERLNAYKTDLMTANTQILFLRTLVDSGKTCMSRKAVRDIFGW